jgi:RNA ligase (TIGR02306 family)
VLGVHSGNIGEDVTALAGVMKYEKPIPASLAGEVAGAFPSFIPKTDELHFQKAPELVAALRGMPWCATVKLDGSSATYFRDGDHFGVCTRNWERRPHKDNSFWQLAWNYELPDKLPDGMAIQCEVCGPGICGNPLGLKTVQMWMFDVWDIDMGGYEDRAHVEYMGQLLEVPVVEQIAGGDAFDLDDDGLRLLAEGTYPNGRPREGIVVRPTIETMVGQQRLSFKVMNLVYKEQ